MEEETDDLVPEPIEVSSELMEVKEPKRQGLAPQSTSLALSDGQRGQDTVSNLLSRAMPFLDDPIMAAIVPWFCDKLGSDLSMKDYRRDLSSFWLRMKAQGINPLEVTGDHVRVYKKTLQKAGSRSASISRYLSVIRGVYQQLAIHGQVPWDVAQDIQAIERAGDRCEYCLIHQEDAIAGHQIDHVIAEKHGGPTSLENLALSCVLCNLRKGSDLSSIDPESGAVASLFNPRTQEWSDHFRIEHLHILGSTPTGRATVHLLQLNSYQRLAERRELRRAKRLPWTD